MRLTFTSTSLAHRAALATMGIIPIIQISTIDEDTVLTALLDGHAFPGCTTTSVDKIAALAVAKCTDIRKALSIPGTNTELPKDETILVVGCDSILEIDGRMLGKPRTPDIARERIRAVRRVGTTPWTGHSATIFVPASSDDGQGHEHMITTAVTHSTPTQVHFRDTSDAEIDAYVATGEPLRVVGSFTMDELGGPLIEGVTGDYHLVVGISLPLLHSITTEPGVLQPDLQDAPHPWISAPIAPTALYTAGAQTTTLHGTPTLQQSLWTARHSTRDTLFHT